MLSGMDYSIDKGLAGFFLGQNGSSVLPKKNVCLCLSIYSRTSQLRIEQIRHAYQLDYYWSKQNEGSAVAYLKHTIEN